MIKLLKTKDTLGITIFNVFEFSLHKNKGILVDTAGIMLRFAKYFINLQIGKGAKNGKKTEQELKESKNNVASA